MLHDALLEATGDELMDPEEIEIGKCYFFQTFGFFYVGKVTHRSFTTVTLSPCCWIPEVGRHTQAMESLDFAEVEVYPQPYKLSLVYVYGAMQIDEKKMPRKQKPAV